MNYTKEQLNEMYPELDKERLLRALIVIGCFYFVMWAILYG